MRYAPNMQLSEMLQSDCCYNMNATNNHQKVSSVKGSAMPDSHVQATVSV